MAGSTGDHSPITITTVDTGPLPPVAGVPAAAGPVGITMHVPLFVGRGRELARLQHALASGPGAVVQAVHGLGGIGKSALAAQYVALHADRRLSPHSQPLPDDQQTRRSSRTQGHPAQPDSALPMPSAWQRLAVREPTAL